MDSPFARAGSPARAKVFPPYRTGMEKITVRALNRALLARQLLLARERRGVLDTVEHLVGLQSQVPGAPYTGLWARLDGFDPEDVSRLMTDRALVRMSTLRGTVHLHSAADALALRPLCQQVNDRGPFGRSVYRRALAGVDPAALATAARRLLTERPLTNTELGAALLADFPGYTPSDLAWAVRDGLPLVQVPPRGLWGRGGRTTSTTVEHWLGRSLDPEPSPDRLVLRYLAAFGPAGVRDAQAWSGLTRLAEVFERLRPRLRGFADAATGRELFDLPDARARTRTRPRRSGCCRCTTTSCSATTTAAGSPTRTHCGRSPPATATSRPSWSTGGSGAAGRCGPPAPGRCSRCVPSQRSRRPTGPRWRPRPGNCSPCTHPPPARPWLCSTAEPGPAAGLLPGR